MAELKEGISADRVEDLLAKVSVRKRLGFASNVPRADQVEMFAELFGNQIRGQLERLFRQVIGDWQPTNAAGAVPGLIDAKIGLEMPLRKITDVETGAERLQGVGQVDGTYELVQFNGILPQEETAIIVAARSQILAMIEKEAVRYFKQKMGHYMTQQATAGTSALAAPGDGSAATDLSGVVSVWQTVKPQSRFGKILWHLVG